MNSVKSTKNFKVETDPMMACPCCGVGGLSVSILIVLETVRAHFDKPVTINSGPRCVKHNASVGGSTHSEHLVMPEDPESGAVDIMVQGVAPFKVYKFLKELPYANLLGLGKYKTFTHVDTRGYGARWVG